MFTSKASLLFVTILIFVFSTQVFAQYQLKKLGPEINSEKYDEISPVITRDGRTMYFTRVGAPGYNRTLLQDDIDLSKTLTEKEYLDTLRFIYSQIANESVSSPSSSLINQDVWIADSRDDAFDRVFRPGFPLNNALPNSICSLAPADQVFVIINQFTRDGSMSGGFSMIERRPNGSFSFPEPIQIENFYSNSPEVNFCMSKKGDVIILSLNGHPDSVHNDLYVSFKLKDNIWSEPVNLGPTINSSFREMTPFLTEDRKRIFFSSNRPGGLGGNDIYVSRRLDYSWTNWSPPQSLPVPINSMYDDSNPVLIEPNTYMYFISKRDGSSDIFKVDLNPTPEAEEPVTIHGTIRNSITKELIAADLYFGPSYLTTTDSFITTDNGRFEFILKKKDLYRLSPRKPGFVGTNQLIDVSILAQSKQREYQVDMYITPLQPELLKELSHIYFELGTTKVLASSFPSLDRLSLFLTENPTLHIRIDGHTDTVGRFVDLIDLSKSRADSIKKYLVTHRHIQSERITTRGLGGTRPKSPNHTEELRAKNRRVEIAITKYEYGKKINFNFLNPSEVGDKEIMTDEVNGSKSKNPTAVLTSSKSHSLDTSNIQLQYTNIYFNTNEFAIKEASFPEIQKLIHQLRQSTQRIVLIGMCDDSETFAQKSVAALQRAKGIKEYLRFKSITADRIRIEEAKEPGEFAGVKLLIEN